MKESKQVLKEVRSLLANLDYHISKIEKDKSRLTRSVNDLNKEVLEYASEEKKQEKKAFKYAEFLANKAETRIAKQIFDELEKYADGWLKDAEKHGKNSPIATEVVFQNSALKTKIKKLRQKFLQEKEKVV